MGGTVENVFMGRCTFLEYIYGWVWVFVTVKGTFLGGCTFFEFTYGWVESTFMSRYEWL